MFRFFDIGSSFLNDLYFQQSDAGNTGRLNVQHITEPTAANPRDTALLNEESHESTNDTTDSDYSVRSPDDLQSSDEDDDSSTSSDSDSDRDTDARDVSDKRRPEDAEEVEEEEEEETSEEEENADTTEEAKKKEADKDKSLFARLKDIDKDIYKKVPELRNIIAQHQQFSQHFATPQEAEEAVNTVDIFNEMETDLLDGKTEKLFQSFKNNAPDALPRIAKNLLGHLYKVDRDAYNIAMKPEINNLIREFHKAGVMNNNQDIQRSAGWLAKWLTGDHKIPSGETGPTEEEKRLQKERDEAVENSFRRDLSRVDSVCTARAEAQILKIVDPKQALPERIRKNLIEDVMKELGAEIRKDAAYMQRLSRLTQSAKRTNFSRGEDASIVDAYLARVKNLLPKIARKVMEEWDVKSNDNGESRDSKGKESKTEGKSTQNRVSGGGTSETKNAGNGKLGYNPDNVDWTKTSNMDVFNGVYTHKNGKRIRFKKQY